MTKLPPFPPDRIIPVAWQSEQGQQQKQVAQATRAAWADWLYGLSEDAQPRPVDASGARPEPRIIEKDPSP